MTEEKTQDTPQTFDLDAWITGSSRPTTAIPVTQRGDLLAQMDILAHKIRLAEQVNEVTSNGFEEETLGEADDLEAHRHQYKALADAYEATVLMVTLRALDSDEWKTVLEAAVEGGHDPKDVREMTLWTISAAMSAPKLDVEQLRRFRDAIGDTQWGQVVDAYNELRAGHVGPSADFLPSASSSQSPDEY